MRIKLRLLWPAHARRTRRCERARRCISRCIPVKCRTLPDCSSAARSWFVRPYRWRTSCRLDPAFNGSASHRRGRHAGRLQHRHQYWRGCRPDGRSCTSARDSSLPCGRSRPTWRHPMRYPGEGAVLGDAVTDRDQRGAIGFAEKVLELLDDGLSTWSTWQFR